MKRIERNTSALYQKADIVAIQKKLNGLNHTSILRTSTLEKDGSRNFQIQKNLTSRFLYIQKEDIQVSLQDHSIVSF